MFQAFKNYVGLIITFICLIISNLANAEDIRIAVRANKGAQNALKQWQPTADYLSEKVAGYRFIIVPFENNSALNQAVSQGNFHFCLTNPAAAVEHTIRYGGQPIATLVNKRQGKGYAKFGSVIFTRANRSDINHLKDLKGKIFTGADELGFGGWRAAWFEMLNNGINPYTDFKHLRFAGGIQQKVVYAVLDGRSDAGAVRTDMLERMAAAGKIELSDFKVIGKKTTKNFPFLHSTDLYPEWMFLAIQRMDDVFKTQVITALFSIPSDSNAANTGKYVGWISPLDYSPVDNLLNRLRVGPYNVATMDSFERLVDQYGLYLLSLLIVVTILALIIAYMLQLNKRIVKTQQSLTSEIHTRQRAENVLSSLAQQTLNYTKDDSFFNECLINLSELFNTQYAFIGLFDNPEKTRIQTYAVRAHGQFIDNFTYDLKGTPCQDVLDLKLELVSNNAAIKYPNDELLSQMGIESYFGAPLVSPTGLMIGLVSVMDIKPINPDKSLRPLLTIFANRIAMEMQRKREENELQGMAQQLSYQASHDALTGLVNRREFEARMRSAWDTATKNNEHHALCYLDLDQFKVVNDTCGHQAGDELLKQLALKLDIATRGSDTLARLGGDEFGILLLDCPMDQAEEIAQKLLDTIKNFRFAWEDNFFEIGASIGLVPINSMSRDIHELLQAADSACYVAKDQGRNRIHVYKEDDIAIASHQGEIRWVSEINRALDKNDFILYRQPIQSLNSSTPAHREHYEILIRMQDKNGEILLPGSFISAAERYNLMYTIDQWVIENSFAFISHHYSTEDQTSNKILHAINLSGLSIGIEKLSEFIDQMISKYNVLPQSICFEITETAAISNFSQAIKFIEKMTHKGFYFSLDDFGTGLCSYAYLRSLPVNYLKIDGRFVSGLMDDPMNRAIIESIVHIAKVMQVHTIAEWVENETVLNELKKMGVNYAQGYHIDMPTPVTDKIKESA